MQAFFVTGTDTGVGKTYVSVALLEEAARRGLRTAAMKPAETGCEQRADGRLRAGDADQLSAATTLPFDGAIVCPFRYEEAAAPVIAARTTGTMPDLVELRRCWDVIVAENPDLILVEGAGGLLVGWNEEMTMADVAAAFGLPLVVVARDGLGTLNHTLLTIEAAERRGLEVAAVVLNGARAGADPARVASNAEELSGLGVPVSDVVPHGGGSVASTLDRLMSVESVPRETLD